MKNVVGRIKNIMIKFIKRKVGDKETSLKREVHENILLSVQNLSVSYGPIQALKSVDIDVHKGSIVAILGANGAGKTSLLKKISGLTQSQDGAVVFNGENITRLAAEKITKKGIVQSPEGRQIFGDLTVHENLMIGSFTSKEKSISVASLKKHERNQRVKEIIESSPENADDLTVTLTKKEIIELSLQRVYSLFPVLKERKNQVALSLSGGEQQMLAIARALMPMPKLLILDEPSLGLAPLIVKNIFNIVKELNKAGTTILIVEQNALQTLKIADYAYVLQVGKVIKEGKAEVLLNDSELIEAYLGK